MHSPPVFYCAPRTVPAGKSGAAGGIIATLCIKNLISIKLINICDARVFVTPRFRSKIADSNGFRAPSSLVVCRDSYLGIHVVPGTARMRPKCHHGRHLAQYINFIFICYKKYIIESIFLRRLQRLPPAVFRKRADREPRFFLYHVPIGSRNQGYGEDGHAVTQSVRTLLGLFRPDQPLRG